MRDVNLQKGVFLLNDFFSFKNPKQKIRAPLIAFSYKELV